MGEFHLTSTFSNHVVGIRLGQEQKCVLNKEGCLPRRAHFKPFLITLKYKLDFLGKQEAIQSFFFHLVACREGRRVNGSVRAPVCRSQSLGQ